MLPCSYDFTDFPQQTSRGVLAPETGLGTSRLALRDEEVLFLNVLLVSRTDSSRQVLASGNNGFEESAAGLGKLPSGRAIFQSLPL